MIRRFFLILFAVLSVAMSANAQLSQRYLDYIEQYKDVAIDQMNRYGIPASITLAQGLLESAAGQSSLARDGNNHFGIKCHTWTGRTMYKDDDAKNECFRAYNSAVESFEDHSLFLRRGQRYASLFTLKRNDYQGWAHGLKAAGYATNPQYATSLINIIETYQLYRFDNGKTDRFIQQHQARPSGSSTPVNGHTIRMANKNYFVFARQGDTYASIGNEVGISAKKLAKYNERDANYVLQKGDVVWLKKKQKRADKAYKGVPHVVKAGESMYSISQKYGIRLEKLYKMNYLDPYYVLQVGDQLRVY